MKNKEEMREYRGKVFSAGCFLGLVLTASSIFALSIQNRTETVSALLPWFPAIVAGYLLLGILITWLYTMPRRKLNIGAYTKGIALSNWLFLAGLVLLLIFSFVIPEVMHLPILFNVLVLAACWAFNYLSVLHLSKELNRNAWKQSRVFIEDLDECPKNREEFFERLESYCRKNHRELEYVEKNNPAIIKMDGVYYLVSVEQSFHRFGPLYSLKFEEMSQK